jgi:hypothetical protein
MTQDIVHRLYQPGKQFSKVKSIGKYIRCCLPFYTILSATRYYIIYANTTILRVHALYYTLHSHHFHKLLPGCGRLRLVIEQEYSRNFGNESGRLLQIKIEAENPLEDLQL